MPVQQQRRRCEEATLQSNSKLGSFNAAVVAVYFALVWGGDGFRILRSPLSTWSFAVLSMSA
jgi:hypothetical protein